MYKKLSLAVAIIGATVIFSGCSLLPASNQGNNATKQTPEVFNSKSKIGSLWKTSDGGHTFDVKSQVDEKTIISSANILSIAYNPKKEQEIYVSSVESGIFKTEDSGAKWTPIAFPPKKIYSFILDKNDPNNRMFASGVVGDWGKIFRSEDAGQNWEEVYTEPGQKATVTALAQHIKDNNVIFAGTSGGTIVKSVDFGDTWKNVGNKFDSVASDFAFDSSKKMSVYLLIFDKKFYYSQDGGNKWIDWEVAKQEEVQAIQEQANEAAQNGNAAESTRLQKKASDLSKRNQDNKMPSSIISIASDPTVSGTIYAGTRTGLFRSTDFGKYWYEINIIESAKKFPIRSIAINLKNSNEIVFVAGKAFYKSINRGDTWEVTGLNVDRDASFVSYDPFDSKYLFVGLRKYE